MQQAFGLNIPQTLEDICDPTRLALVVYDMQVGIREARSRTGNRSRIRSFRFSRPLAKREFASFSRATCRCRGN